MATTNGIPDMAISACRALWLYDDIDRQIMERVFVESAAPCDVAGPWSGCCDYAQIHTLLNQAARRAAATGQATSASLILPVPVFDPLRIFQICRYLYARECFYWEQPSRQAALVGSGTALSIELHGPGRFMDATVAWQQLRDNLVMQYAPDFLADPSDTGHGPVLVGGFSFDPLRTPSPLWKGFPDGRLVLPRLLFSQHDNQATLTLSCPVQATDDLDDLTYGLRKEITKFASLLGTRPDLPENEPSERLAYAPHDTGPAETWKKLVSSAVQSIKQGTYAKIVLARKVEVRAGARPFRVVTTLQRLRQSYPGACVFAFQRGERAFIGATPERLVRAQGGKLHTVALAGSASRGMTEEEDLRLGNALLYSPKNREEHEIVIATIRDSLTHLCSRVQVADAPELLHLKNIQHLQTAIVGELLPGRSMLEALHLLHPTPAVGGAPTESALAFIRAHENLDRGWYAGPIGWIDLQGNGEFTVALRSALVEKRQATLFAGCGIVKDSDPETEYAESCLKLQVILRSLSGEE